MIKSEYNYAIVKALYLKEYWVGKTKLTVDNIGIFAKYSDAVKSAINIAVSSRNKEELENQSECQTDVILEKTERQIVR